MSHSNEVSAEVLASGAIVRVYIRVPKPSVRLV